MRKRVFVLLMTIILALSCMNFTVYAEKEDADSQSDEIQTEETYSEGPYTYTLCQTVYGTMAEIESYSGADTNIVIPEKLGGYPVGYVYNYTFKDIQLETVKFPSTLKCYAGTPYQSKIKEITIPEGVIWINSYAFKDMRSLQKVVIPASVTEFVDDKSLTDMNNTSVTFYVPVGSYAESWLKQMNWPHVVATGTTKSVQSITLDQNQMEMNSGERKIIQASLNPADSSNRAIIWTSSNSEVACPEDNTYTSIKGTDQYIKAVGPGTAVITATTMDGEKVASCTVTVKAPISEISLNLTDTVMKRGSNLTLIATIEPANTTESKTIEWSSSDDTIVSVDSKGVLTAKAEGSATITARAGTKTATCKVLVTANTPTSTKVPIYRLYSPVNGEHLYTTDENEVRVLVYQHGWNYEGVSWFAPNEGTPVYRLYNAGLQNHLYTTDTNEVNVLTTQHGWSMDNNGNALFYSGGSTPIYRLYNRELRGLHLWTNDGNEYNVLPGHGWKQEGIVMYGMSSGDSKYPMP